MSQFQKELEFAYANGFISGVEREDAMNLVNRHPEELPRQLTFIKGINRLLCL